LGKQNCRIFYGWRIYTAFFKTKYAGSFNFCFYDGIFSQKSGRKGQVFRSFIASGYEVMKELLLLIMKVAPIGLGAYFAYQVATLGPQLFGFYAKPLGLYYIAGVFIFWSSFHSMRLWQKDKWS
jgi:Na+/H+-dicarboxylate symporter